MKRRLSFRFFLVLGSLLTMQLVGLLGQKPVLFSGQLPNFEFPLRVWKTIAPVVSGSLKSVWGLESMPLLSNDTENNKAGEMGTAVTEMDR